MEESENVPQLRIIGVGMIVVSVGRNWISNVRIVAMPAVVNIRQIFVSENNIGRRGAQLLAKANLPQL